MYLCATLYTSFYSRSYLLLVSFIFIWLFFLFFIHFIFSLCLTHTRLCNAVKKKKAKCWFGTYKRLNKSKLIQLYLFYPKNSQVYVYLNWNVGRYLQFIQLKLMMCVLLSRFYAKMSFHHLLWRGTTIRISIIIMLNRITI